MAIPKETVDQIYNTLKIEEVVSDYVSLKRKGANLEGLCPFPGHNEKTPSFKVHPGRGICKCFGCGRGGNAVNFVMEMEQCSYVEALRRIANKYNIQIEEREMTAAEQQRHDDRESMFVANEWANKWYQEQLWNSQEGQAIGLSYFHERGLKDETIRKFQLGYSPESAALLPESAAEQGFKEEYLLNNAETGIGTGLCGRSSKTNKLYDRYHERVIFPFINRSGKTTGFAGRLIKKRDDVGKYVNSPESLIYKKHNELFGIFQAKLAIHKANKCYLVEGQMDCISMSQAGIENVVCSGGTSLTKDQISLLHRFTSNVTILYDGDAAGIKAALKGINMFLEEGINVKVMLFPDGDDPDSFSRKHTAEEFVQYIADHEEDFILYEMRTLLADAGRDLKLRGEAIKTIVTSIALIEDRITCNMYLRECARVLNVKENALMEQFAKDRDMLRQKAIEEQKKAMEEARMKAGAVEDLDPYMQMQMSQEVVSHTEENVMNLMRALVCYGERMLLFQGAEGTYELRVGDYMQSYIEQTRLPLGKPIYERMFEEFNAHKDEEGFKAETFFLRHQDQEISTLVTNLLAEKDSLCSTYAKADEGKDMQQINSLMTQLLYELHYTTVNDQLKQIESMLNDPSVQSVPEQWKEVLSTQQQLLGVRQQLSQLLGKV